MKCAGSSVGLPDEPSERRRAALLNLLADDDPAVYQEIRRKILSLGPSAAAWLRPSTLSREPALRRRAQELVLHFDRQAADNAFLAFCLKHGEEFDLEAGAWLLAQTQYPEINIEAYRALLDSYANELSGRFDPAGEPKQILGAFNHYLFSELCFAGNQADYSEPDNDYLNRVIDRRTGNPINLCLIYLLLARRLRLPIAGIGLPGHFVCRYQSTAVEIYLDVFNRGKFLTKADCVSYLVQANLSVRDEFLAPITSRRFLLRICANLHQTYRQLELAEEATRLQHYLVALAR
jgi:regulator of sirC expression with transglutaminase-like and TPR domain